jgi:hypothetical protein
LQIYGSQTTFDKKGQAIIFEIKNPEYVNERRKEIGLKPIENYLKQRHVEFNIPQKTH